MFFFKKNSPILSDLFPVDYVDIHSHLLPGIDDGAKSNEDTQSLLSFFKSIGSQQLITTPHIIHSVWDNTEESIQMTFNDSVSLFTDEGIQLRAAAEYLMDSTFYESIKHGKQFLTLKDNYILVEMSYINSPMNLYDILFELQVLGYKPVLAHPERYAFYHSKFDEYYRLKKAGCLFQLNLLSSVGYYGPDVTKIAQKLIDLNLYDFVGTDLHHGNHVKAFGTKIQFKKELVLNELMAKNEFFKL